MKNINEVKINHLEGTDMWTIDVWETDDPNEEGEVIGYIELNGTVHFVVRSILYSEDCYSNQQIMQAVKQKCKELGVEPKRVLNVACTCQAEYNSSINVPIDLSIDEAIEYAKDNVGSISVEDLERIEDSDEVDEENCDFAD